MVCSGVRLNYRQLHARVDQCARALVGAGVLPGDRVAYLSPPHRDCVVVLLAALAVGAIAVGINPGYRRREIAHVLNDSAPRVFFSRTRIGSRSYAEDLAAASPPGTRVVTLGDWKGPEGSETLLRFMRRRAAAGPDEPGARAGSVEAESPGLLVYTSGTTGAPKGALLKQKAALRHGKVFLRRLQLDSPRAINCYPTNHVAGVVATTLQTLIGGGTLVCMERFDAGRVLATIESERITIWGGVPAMLQMCAEHASFGTTDLSSVRVVLWSGGALGRDLAKTLSTRVPRLATLYGMTETTGGVTAIESDGFAEALCASVGRPLPDVEIRIVGEDGDVAKAGEAGELRVRGDCLMAGYWNDPEATAAAFDPDGWLRTGDVARLDRAGCIRLLGHRIEMFKSGGYNVYPREVETVLEAHPGVACAVVVGTKDALYGEVGIAFVQARSAGPRVSESTLLDHCKRQLANYKVPKRIRIVAGLPMLANGKLDRKQLAGRALRDRRPQ